MTRPKYDGVIEAVRYSPDGKLMLARAYERRGPAFSDRVLLDREELLQRLDSGEKFVTGQRVPYMGGKFEVSAKVRLVRGNDDAVWLIDDKADPHGTERDLLKSAPLF
jgi:hypothetical protein